MNAKFKLLLKFDSGLNESSDDARRHVYANSSIVKKFTALIEAFNFGQMPFDRCVVCEGSNDIIKCGDEMQTTETISRMREWIVNILDVIRGEICSNHRDEGIVEFGFTDDCLTYGFCLNVRLEGSPTIFHFKVMPKTADAFNMNVTPEIEHLILKGDYQK